MKRINIIALLMCCLLIGAALLAPGFLTEELGRDFALQWLQRKKEPWTGVLQVWHVTQWSPARGNGITFLRSRANAFEKKHPGVFLELDSMPANEALSRIAGGEYPHIISFPSGWGQSGMFQEIPEANCYAHLLKSARAGGKQLAMPYMTGGYAILYNEDMFSDMELDIPLEPEPQEFRTTAEKMTRTKKLGKKSTSYTGLELPNAAGSLPSMALLIQEPPLIPGEGRYIADNTAFKNGLAAMMVGGPRALEDTKGYTFSVQARALGRFTDMVQYAGIPAGVRGMQLDYARDFIEELMSDRSQMELEKLGAFPVRKMDMYAGDTAMQAMLEASSGAMVPRAFAYAKALKDMEPLIGAALNGDEAQIKRAAEVLRAACVSP